MELSQLELESMAWFREMRLKDEEWLAQHIPIRDAVFEEHEYTTEKAKSSSARAQRVWAECEWTQEQYRNMKSNYKVQMDFMNKAC